MSRVTKLLFFPHFLAMCGATSFVFSLLSGHVQGNRLVIFLSLSGYVQGNGISYFFLVTGLCAGQQDCCLPRCRASSRVLGFIDPNVTKILKFFGSTKLFCLS